MLKRGHIKAPRSYSPGKGHPREHLAYMNKAEMELLRVLTDGTVSRGPKGLPSFAVSPDAKSFGTKNTGPSGGMMGGTGSGGSVVASTGGSNAPKSGVGNNTSGPNAAAAAAANKANAAKPSNTPKAAAPEAKSSTTQAANAAKAAAAPQAPAKTVTAPKQASPPKNFASGSSNTPAPPPQKSVNAAAANASRIADQKEREKVASALSRGPGTITGALPGDLGNTSKQAQTRAATAIGNSMAVNPAFGGKLFGPGTPADKMAGDVLKMAQTSQGETLGLPANEQTASANSMLNRLALGIDRPKMATHLGMGDIGSMLEGYDANGIKNAALQNNAFRKSGLGTSAMSDGLASVAGALSPVSNFSTTAPPGVLNASHYLTPDAEKTTGWTNEPNWGKTRTPYGAHVYGNPERTESAIATARAKTGTPLSLPPGALSPNPSYGSMGLDTPQPTKPVPGGRFGGTVPVFSKPSVEQIGYTFDKPWQKKGVQPIVLSTLDRASEIFGQDLTVISGFRPPAYNKAKGGVKNSQHMTGGAVDISTAGMTNAEKQKLVASLAQAGFKRIGGYSGSNMIHADMMAGTQNLPQYRAGQGVYSMWNKSQTKMPSAPSWFKNGIAQGTGAAGSSGTQLATATPPPNISRPTPRPAESELKAAYNVPRPTPRPSNLRPEMGMAYTPGLPGPMPPKPTPRPTQVPIPTARPLPESQYTGYGAPFTQPPVTPQPPAMRGATQIASGFSGVASAPQPPAMRGATAIAANLPQPPPPSYPRSEYSGYGSSNVPPPVRSPASVMASPDDAYAQPFRPGPPIPTARPLPDSQYSGYGSSNVPPPSEASSRSVPAVEEERRGSQYALTKDGRPIYGQTPAAAPPAPGFPAADPATALARDVGALVGKALSTRIGLTPEQVRQVLNDPVTKRFIQAQANGGLTKTVADAGFNAVYGPKIKQAITDAIRSGQSYLDPNSYPTQQQPPQQPQTRQPAGITPGVSGARYNGTLSGEGNRGEYIPQQALLLADALAGRGGGGGSGDDDERTSQQPTVDDWSYYMNVMSAEEAKRRLLGPEWYA